MKNRRNLGFIDVPFEVVEDGGHPQASAQSAAIRRRIADSDAEDMQLPGFIPANAARSLNDWIQEHKQAVMLTAAAAAGIALVATFGDEPEPPRRRRRNPRKKRP